LHADKGGVDEDDANLLTSRHPLVIKLVDANRRIGAEVHSPGGHIVALLSKCAFSQINQL
jgi:hypothetical protein